MKNRRDSLVQDCQIVDSWDAIAKHELDSHNREHHRKSDRSTVADVVRWHRPRADGAHRQKIKGHGNIPGPKPKATVDTHADDEPHV